MWTHLSFVFLHLSLYSSTACFTGYIVVSILLNTSTACKINSEHPVPPNKTYSKPDSREGHRPPLRPLETASTFVLSVE